MQNLVLRRRRERDWWLCEKNLNQVEFGEIYSCGKKLNCVKKLKAQENTKDEEIQIGFCKNKLKTKQEVKINDKSNTCCAIEDVKNVSNCVKQKTCEKIAKTTQIIGKNLTKNSDTKHNQAQFTYKKQLILELSKIIKNYKKLARFINLYNIFETKNISILPANKAKTEVLKTNKSNVNQITTKNISYQQIKTKTKIAINSISLQTNTAKIAPSNVNPLNINYNYRKQNFLFAVKTITKVIINISSLIANKANSKDLNTNNYQLKLNQYPQIFSIFTQRITNHLVKRSHKLCLYVGFLTQFMDI